MPRKFQVQNPGAIYLLMNRGDRRDRIFHDDQDRHNFLLTLGQACEKTGCPVLRSNCGGWTGARLLSDVQPFSFGCPDASTHLVAGMKWLLGTYTSRFNRRHREFGHLTMPASPTGATSRASLFGAASVGTRRVHRG